MNRTNLIINQHRLARKVEVRKNPSPVRYIAGVDVAVARGTLVGCIGVFAYPDINLVEYTCATSVVGMPYVPGFLSFREIPVLFKCYRKLKIKPDLLLVDGQGIAHPRAIGLASHLGVLLGKPTIGCAKSYLFGEYEMPEPRRGAYGLLKTGKQKIGVVLRTRTGVRPLWVSPGHLVDVEDCRKYVLVSTRGYRIPEPIRFAHSKAGEHARRLSVRSKA